MTTLYQDLRGALQTAAVAATGFPAANQRAFEGVQFNSTPGTPWAEMTLIPSQGRPYSVSGSKKLHAGLFQVSVYVPAHLGTSAAEIAADNVRAVFTPGSRLAASNNEIIAIDFAERAPIIASPDWLCAPVSVRWRCFSSRN